MSVKRMLLLFAAAFLAVGFVSGRSMADEKRVTIKGSTTVLPITMKGLESFKKIRPDVSISLEGSGSGNGIKALLEGLCDIANSSREMKKDELAKAKAAQLRIKEISISYDMIVPIVHPSNRVKNLTMAQLKGIYDGTIKNWSEVGGDNMNIVVVSRDSSSGTYEYWHEAVMKKTDTRQDSLMQASSGAVVNTVLNNKRAIGYVGFGYLNSTIKPLDVNSVVPTLANGKSGKYPISRKLYMYLNEKKYSEGSRAFVNFLLGREGQKLVSEAGFIPLK